MSGAYVPRFVAMSDELDIDHLSRLARLSLSDAETHQAAHELQNIIAMIDAMQAIDTQGVAPMANPLDAHQRLRSDVVTEEVDRDRFQDNAPLTEQGYYLVPRVVE